jgi:hypothetical protein
MNEYQLLVGRVDQLQVQIKELTRNTAQALQLVDKDFNSLFGRITNALSALEERLSIVEEALEKLLPPVAEAEPKDRDGREI